MEAITIIVQSVEGTPEQIAEFQTLLKDWNVVGEFNNCRWFLTGIVDDLRRVLHDLFNVWNGECSCPILPEELLSNDDIEKLGY